MVPFSDIFLFTITQSCVWEEDRFWSLVNRLSRNKENVTGKIIHLTLFLLQEFVKISRWNDVSFWAIKQSVEKTHR